MGADGAIDFICAPPPARRTYSKGTGARVAYFQDDAGRDAACAIARPFGANPLHLLRRSGNGYPSGSASRMALSAVSAHLAPADDRSAGAPQKESSARSATRIRCGITRHNVVLSLGLISVIILACAGRSPHRPPIRLGVNAVCRTGRLARASLPLSGLKTCLDCGGGQSSDSSCGNIVDICPT